MNQNPTFIPPWKTPRRWRELHRILNHHISSRKPEMAPALAAARDIEALFRGLCGPMDDLCRQTCGMCPDICCLSATIWADFRDVVFWHLSTQTIPLEQNISGPNGTCRYLGEKGCSLPRMSRPFVCTWYLCPTQASRLQSMPDSTRHVLHDTLQALKIKRISMESAFISALL